jgi:anaerobic ribonucleoside-triphosphate reductase activating protein
MALNGEVININIYTTQYSIKNHVLEIYISGCKQKCKGCQNPETWDFKAGKPWQAVKESIIQKCNEDIVKNIWILGGEPLDQDTPEVLRLLKVLRKTNKTIWLFTSYDIVDVPFPVLSLVDYIKVGKYIESKRSDNHYSEGIKLATTNQDVINVVELLEFLSAELGKEIEADGKY